MPKLLIGEYKQFFIWIERSQFTHVHESAKTQKYENTILLTGHEYVMKQRYGI